MVNENLIYRFYLDNKCRAIQVPQKDLWNFLPIFYVEQTSSCGRKCLRIQSWV